MPIVGISEHLGAALFARLSGIAPCRARLTYK
jgi:hypothetical protein